MSGADLLRLTAGQQRAVLQLAGKISRGAEETLALVVDRGVAALSLAESDPLVMLEALACDAGFSVAQLKSRDRKASVCRARHMVMYQLRQQGFSLPEIGALLDKDHTSVLHAIRKIEFERAARKRVG